jgi:hypothetical protein
VIKHRIFLSYVGALAILLLLLFGWAHRQRETAEAGLMPAGRALVARLSLTDFALWSEARYTRHPSQADLFTPFQDFPSSLDHFPADSLMAPTPSRPTTRLVFRHAGKSVH